VPRKGAGVRPALLFIDLYRWAFGDEPEPLLESIKKWPGSCGLAGWNAIPHLQRLLNEARSAGIPVVHVTGMADVVGWRDPPEPGKSPVVPESARRRRYDIIDEVAPTNGETVLRKAAPSAFWGTPLSGVLNGLRVDTVVVAGESTSGCIRATAVDAKSLRYKVLVPEECVFDRDEASHAINLYDIDQKYGDVISVQDAVTYLRSLADARPSPTGIPAGTAEA
jgi:nicotinamidase-related amidase